MLFTGESISAQEALRHGLVSRVVPEDKLGKRSWGVVVYLLRHWSLERNLSFIADEEVSKVTTSIIAKSRAVIELGKKFYYSQIQSDIHTAYRYVNFSISGSDKNSLLVWYAWHLLLCLCRLGEKVMVSNVSMVDGQEGISSFLGKRKPQWKHTEEWIFCCDMFFYDKRLTFINSLCDLFFITVCFQHA